ncbi:MAG: HAD-IC family P-type ATPase [Patescibacteria group bacterium]|nr:HAD-IC family P-type ATPase [Patescibacteria group bacterium]
MSWQDFASLDALEACKNLGSVCENGLSAQEARRRLLAQGKNRVSSAHLSAGQIFWRQLKSPFIYLLLFASLLSFVLQNFAEGFMIILFIFINTALGFFQEYRSEKTAQMLSRLITWRSKVIRGGKEQSVLTEELVAGDIILLETGDKVGADARLIYTQNFSVDESALTGESVAVFKESERCHVGDGGLEAALNMVFAGTAVVGGKATAIITATGLKTEFGQIAGLVAKTKRVSSFEVGINKFSNFILKLTLVTLAFVILLNFIIKGSSLNWLELIIFAIALAIGVIPEALPLVMTFSFSKGAAKLAKKKVVVKRLSAVEDLGNIEILCSDKTGTLTENRLQVAERFASESGKEEEVLLFSLLASAAAADSGDPFDESIRLAAGKSGRQWRENYQVLFDSPFDPRYLRNNVLAEKDGKVIFLVRGALEVIAPMCSQGEIEAAQAWAKEQGRRGRRVLAIASKPIDNLDFDDFCARFREEEQSLSLRGLISFVDPVKASTISAVGKAKELGVGIKVITGDSLDVAAAVGFEVGLCQSPEEAISAADFNKLDEVGKEEALRRYHIFARVAPEQKHDIIKRLQAQYSVGYLGDGINDAPALKAAGVSLAVDNASDIAREAADIILLENDLNIIIEGIREGRAIFANSIKYIKATLASNFGNFYAVAIASLLIDYLPMLPLQILLLNLVSDFPMIAIAGDNVDDEELLTPRRYEVRDIIIAALALGVISTIFDFVFFALFSRISPQVLQTNWFIASTLTELLFIFSIRSRLSIFKARRPSAILAYLTVPAALLAIIIPYTRFGQDFFAFTPPAPQHLLWILGIALLYLVSTEIFKLLYYRQKNLRLGPSSRLSADI